MRMGRCHSSAIAPASDAGTRSLASVQKRQSDSSKVRSQLLLLALGFRFRVHQCLFSREFNLLSHRIPRLSRP